MARGIKRRKWEQDERRREFERQAFLVALPALMAGNWETGGKRWSSMEEYANGAKLMARLAVAKFDFPLEPPDEEPAS